MKTSTINTLGLLGGLLLATSASAYSDGQTGLSGRISGESCLKCHGTDQYAGTAVEVVGAETGPCFDANGSLVANLPVIAAGSDVTVKVTVTEPGADQAACPVNNCCDDGSVPGAGDVCLTYDQEDNIVCAVGNFTDCCRATLSDCPEGKSAGFNIEAVDAACTPTTENCDGVGSFTANLDNGVRLGRAVGEEVENEATHTVAKGFDGDVTWEIPYSAPNQAANGVAFWVGVNVANGNFLADSGDLNSNYRLDAFMPNPTEAFPNHVSAPDFCAVCPTSDDGFNNGLPNADGTCPACACVTPGSTSLPAGLFGLLFLGLFVGRRRRNAR